MGLTSSLHSLAILTMKLSYEPQSKEAYFNNLKFLYLHLTFTGFTTNGCGKQWTSDMPTNKGCFFIQEGRKSIRDVIVKIVLYFLLFFFSTFRKLVL